MTLYQPYRIKVFNTIDFAKSMHYNPFAYISERNREKDILKFVDVLIKNTTSSQQSGGLISLFLSKHHAEFTGSSTGTGSSIWTTIETLCNNVVVPIGGFILVVILLSDLIKTVINGNNFKDFDMNDIARVLREKKIIRPKYRKAVSKGKNVDADDIFKWTGCAVKEILRRQEYVGDTVNFRTECVSYKTKKKVRKQRDEYLIFPDRHPAIISREDFQRVQDKYDKKFRHKGENHHYLLADQVYCMDCHARMHGRKVSVIGGLKANSYECTVYHKGKGCCFHGVPEDYLIDIVLKSIQSVFEYAKSDYVAFSKEIQRILDENSDGTKAVMQSELEKAQKRNAEIDKYIQGLFEAKVKGEIDGTLFANLKKTYDEEKNQLSKVIIYLIEKLNDKNDNSDKVKILFQAVRKYDAVTELTPEVLVDFIERIEVGKFKTTFNVTSNRAIPFKERDNLVSVYFWGVGIINFIEK